MRRSKTPQDVRRWFLRQVSELWPLAAGSLSLRTGRCIRENCSACERGEGHASYAFYGRKLEKLMREAGLRYTVALKAKRAAGASVRKRRAR